MQDEYSRQEHELFRTTLPKTPEKSYKPLIPHTDEQRAAADLGIPEANRENPAVKDFLTQLVRVENLEHDAPILSGYPESSFAQTRDLFGSGAMKLPLQARYAVTHYLARAAEWVMKEGMGETVDNEDHVLERITLALGQLSYDAQISRNPPDSADRDE